MKPLNLVNLLCCLTLLSTLAYLLKLPDDEETQTKTGHDPFSILSPQVSSKHREMMMKLRKLHLARGTHTNGTCLLYISILLVTLSNDVQLNPGPRPPKYPCGSCGNAVKQNQNLVSRDSRGCQGKKKAFWEWKLGERPKTKENWLVINRKITTSNLRKLCRIESARQRQSARQEILDAKYEDTRLFHRLINREATLNKW